jgi:hypothetical protein
MATIPRVLLSRTNESASPVCPFMAPSRPTIRVPIRSAYECIADLTRWKVNEQRQLGRDRLTL